MEMVLSVYIYIYIYIYMLKTFLALEKRTVFSGEMDIGQLYLGLNHCERNIIQPYSCEHQEKSSQQIS